MLNTKEKTDNKIQDIIDLIWFYFILEDTAGKLSTVDKQMCWNQCCHSIKTVTQCCQNIRNSSYRSVLLLDIREHSGVTRVGDTRGITPLFFSWKTWRPFLVSRLSAVSPCSSFSWKTDDNFFAHHCHFLLILLGCHPLEGVTRGGAPPSTPLL